MNAEKIPGNRFAHAKIFKFPILLLVGLVFFNSCKKEEGIGGAATIRGKILVHEYSAGGIYQGSYYGPEERVYLIFGNDEFYGEDLRTSYDGTYEFNYLYPGKYTIFSYSRCDTCLSGTTAVLKEVEITKAKQVLEVEDIIIDK